MPRKGMYKGKSQLSKRSLKKMMESVSYSTQETKHHRVTELAGPIGNLGSALELNTVDAQNVASGGFIGQEIRQMGIRLKGALKQQDSSNIVRWMVVTFSSQFLADLQSLNNSFADVFYDPTLPLYSPIRECNIQKVYLDRTVVLNQTTQQNDKISLFDKWIPLGFKKYKVIESGPPVAGSDKIFLLAFSDSTVPGHPTITVHSTLYYKDA